MCSLPWPRASLQRAETLKWRMGDGMNVTEVTHAACHRPEPDATFLADLGRPLPPGATPGAPLRGLPLCLPTHAPHWATPWL